MRDFNDNFDAVKDSNAKSPRYAVKIFFDDAGTNFYWVTSHASTLLPGGTSAGDVSHNVVTNVNLTSQQIYPDEGRSTIGSGSFSVIDKDSDLSTEFKAQLDAGRGMRHKKVEFYVGDESFASWDDFELFQTQIITGVTFDSGRYSIKTSDIQRKARKEIFEVEKTNLTASVGIDALSISVVSTAAFDLVKHGTSYTDAPSLTVGYIRIEDEVIRYTSKTATKFSGITRGVLGTAAAEHNLDPDSDPLEAEEFIYLELPSVKLAYAILTGELYGDSAQLPDHWHLGIATADVTASEFTDIGLDWWDTSDDNAGVIQRFESLKKQDGKKFIEKEIMLFLGAYMPVRADGSLGLVRAANVIYDSATSEVLDDTVVVSTGALTHDQKKVFNKYSVEWNFNYIEDKYTRKNILIDADSISTHDDGRVKALKFRGLHGSRYTIDAIGYRFNSLRDRYAGPPLMIEVQCQLKMAHLEVGDVVRLRLDQVRDYTGDVIPIDRAFEIQKTAINWQSGTVSLSLFGSSQKAGAITYDTAANALPDSYYTGDVNISTLPGYSLIGSVGHLTTSNSPYTFTGDTVLGNSGVYYHDGDLEIDSSVVVNLTDNVLLKVKGHLQVNGTISGVGGGIAGQVFSYTSGEAGGVGTPGAFGATRPQGALHIATNASALTFATSLQSKVTTSALWASSVPEFSLEVSGSTLKGLPGDLRGTSGGYGGASDWLPFFSPDTGHGGEGGNGGDGGAGLCVVTRDGVTLGASGLIDTSGDDGSVGLKLEQAEIYSYGGTGAGGAPGAQLYILDGPSALQPSLAKLSAKNGACTPATTPASHPIINDISGDPTSYYVGFGDDENRGGAVRVQYLISEQAPLEDSNLYADDPLAITATETTNTPRSAKANLATLTITVTPPSDGNYDYANIYYREVGTTAWNSLNNPADDSTTQVVPMDGKTYEGQARSVSIAGVEAPSGPTTSITVSNVDPGVDDEPVTDILTVPNVRGLELYEQGNDVEFVGKDAKFVWREASLTEFQDVGEQGGGLGEEAGTLDLYFRDYQITVTDSSDRVLRREYTTDPMYVYTHEKNAEDYLRVNEVVGRNRTFTASVVMRVNYASEVSPRPANLTVTNPAPAAPSDIVFSGIFQSVKLTYTIPTDTDFIRIKVWGDTSSGFTRDDTTLLYEGAESPITIPELSTGTEYFFRIRSFDEFGQGDESAEYSTTTANSIDAGELADLSNWATRLTAADQAFIDANIGSSAITSTRIVSLVAAKIAAGTLSARVAVAGVFTATGTTSALNETGLSAGTWRVDLGPVSDGGTTYMLRLHNGAGNNQFYIDSAGNANYEGTITASAYYTATGTGERIEINDSSDNHINVYDSSNLNVAEIGITTTAAGDTIASFGDSTSSYAGVFAESTDAFAFNGISAGTVKHTAYFLNTNSTSSTVAAVRGNGSGLAIGVKGDSLNGYGVSANSTNGTALIAETSGGSTKNAITAIALDGHGVSATSTGANPAVRGSNSGAGEGVEGVSSAGYGVRASSSGNYGLYAVGPASTHGPILLAPSASAAAPSHAAATGTLWVTSAGVLYIRTGATWTKVGAQ